MAYPALPTKPTPETTSFDDLKQVKKGDHFTLRGYEYRADGDAKITERFGYENLFIQARRKHGAMPSGWELADVSESRKLEGTA